MYGMTPMGVFFTAIFPLEINEQALCQQPHVVPKLRNAIPQSPKGRASTLGACPPWVPISKDRQGCQQRLKKCAVQLDC